MVALFPVTLWLLPTVTPVASRAVAEVAFLQPSLGFAELFKLRTGEAGSFSYNNVGVRSFWGVEITLVFCGIFGGWLFFLACSPLFGGKTSRRLLQRGSNSEQQNISGWKIGVR